jgi:hypothetical protein
VIPATFILDTEDKRARCAKRILALPLEGQIWDVTVKEWEPRRSVEANRRLWALHQEAARATGHSIEELHELMKLKFLPRSTVKVGEFEREVAGSSAKLTKQEFREFMEAVESFYIQELGVVLGEYA